MLKYPTPLVILLLAVSLLTWPALGEKPMPPQASIIDFSSSPAPVWYVVNDGVMGGISRSAMSVTEKGTGEFSGVLSLDYNGGFASVRTAMPTADLSDYQGVALRVRGDGRTYQLRFRTDDRYDGVAYRATFEAPAGQWTTVELKFEDFEPTFRGRVLDNQPPLNTKALEQLIFMLADKKAGPFKLEIEWVRPWLPKEV